MMFGSFFFFALIALGFWWFIQQSGQGGGGGQNPFAPRGEDPVETARRRYARGEIEKEQYEEIRKTLGG